MLVSLAFNGSIIASVGLILDWRHGVNGGIVLFAHNQYWLF
jgi:hypothetical protein